MKIWRFTAPAHQLIAVALVTTLLVISYSAIIPTVVAKHYLVKLEHELNSTDRALKEVAAEAQVPAFTNPDVSLATRSAQLDTAMEEVAKARGALAELGTANHLAELPGTGMASDYRTATVRHNQSRALVQQSEQVLADYRQLLEFLSAYTDRQIKLDQHLNNFNAVRDFGTLVGKGSTMHKTALAIRADAQSLQAMPPPKDFDALRSESISTFTQAADGFERLARGLNRGADAEIYSAAGWLEFVALKNQLSDKDLLVTLADGSPILLQLAELSEKTEHALGR